MTIKENAFRILYLVGLSIIIIGCMYIGRALSYHFPITTLWN